MLEKKAQTQVPINDVLAQRWSPRAYDANQPVERKVLISLLEAARWAPSCFGAEPWRYMIWDRFADRQTWQKAFECLTPSNQVWVGNAPILMLSLADKLFEDGKINRHAQHDTGAASENLVLQAAASGLIGHQMAGFDAEKIRLAFNIPQQFECMAMIAVGYQASPEILDGKLKDRELAPRNRQPLTKRFFESNWDNPVTL
jgi:nitroreductase